MFGYGGGDACQLIPQHMKAVLIALDDDAQKPAVLKGFGGRVTALLRIAERNAAILLEQNVKVKPPVHG